MTLPQNELSTAASYYLLFSRNRKSPEERENEAAAIPSSSNDEFWMEDTWTQQDVAQAEEQLQSHLEKCTISILNKAPKAGGVGDDDAAWDRFYRDHGTRFFKDRHYFEKAFPDEFGSREQSTNPDLTLVEIGCGVGNALLPLLEDQASPWRTLHGLDISQEAIKLLKQDERFVQCNNGNDKGRKVCGHVCDISKDFPTDCVGVADVTSLLFCLSALDPEDMMQASRHVASSLKPGGTLVFRDYGRFDEAQMKLGSSRNKRLKDNFYRKHDGTKCYYFTLDDLERLFVDGCGLQKLELKSLRRVYDNKGLGEKRRRVWVQARFRKPN